MADLECDALVHLRCVRPSHGFGVDAKPPETSAVSRRGPSLAPVLGAALAFSIPTFVFALVTGWPLWSAVVTAGGVLAQTGAGFVIGIIAVIIWRRVRSPESRALRAGVAYHQSWAFVRSQCSRSRLSALAVTGVSFALVLSAYGVWKMWLNAHVPFRWDPALARVSYTLHGRPAWEYFAALYAKPSVVRVVEWLYNIGWGIVASGVTIWCGFTAREVASHRRFLFASLLAWPLVGVGLAGLLMSAGPVYYGQVCGGPDPYAGLVAALDSTSRSARWAQAYLWDTYHNGPRPGGGISAMPSMHLTSTTLVALVMAGWGSWWRSGAIVFAAGTLVGSVVLGWHYALDGEVGIVLAIALWWVMGPGGSSGSCPSSQVA